MPLMVNLIRVICDEKRGIACSSLYATCVFAERRLAVGLQRNYSASKSFRPGDITMNCINEKLFNVNRVTIMIDQETRILLTETCIERKSARKINAVIGGTYYGNISHRKESKSLVGMSFHVERSVSS